jgi:hypothetical protein
MMYDAGSMMFGWRKPLHTSNELKMENGKFKMIGFHTSNELMRLSGVCCLRATEVVLSGKLGVNEVFSDADGWMTTMTDEHRTRRDARMLGVSTWTTGTLGSSETLGSSGTLGTSRTLGTAGTLGTAATLGSQSPKDFNLDNPLQAEGAARGCESEVERSRRKSKEIEENRKKSKKVERNRKKISTWKSCIFN